MQRMSRTWEVSNKEGDERYLVWELEDVTTKRLVREQSSWKAMHDPLTRLPNRTAFAMRLKEWLQECASVAGSADVLSVGETSTGHGVILYVDLDHFSQVNRQGGREVGDEVLGHIARLIESSVRPHGWVARVGATSLPCSCQASAANRACAMHNCCAWPFRTGKAPTRGSAIC